MAVIAGGARRLDGVPKLRGETLFTQDLKPSGLLHIKLVLSSYPSATIDGVDASEALEIPGVVAVLTSKDLAKADVDPAEKSRLEKGMVPRSETAKKLRDWLRIKMK